MTRVCLDAIYLALDIQQREMLIEEGIAHIKGILNQMKSTWQREKPQRRKRDALHFQISLPFVDEPRQES